MSSPEKSILKVDKDSGMAQPGVVAWKPQDSSASAGTFAASFSDGGGGRRDEEAANATSNGEKTIRIQVDPEEDDVSTTPVFGAVEVQRTFVWKFLAACVIVIVIAIAVAVTVRKNDKDSESYQFPSWAEAVLPEDTKNAIRQDPSSSPQAQAMAWLAFHPEIYTMEDWRILQLMAVATLYYSSAAACHRNRYGDDVTNGILPAHTPQSPPWDKHECDWTFHSNHKPTCTQDRRYQEIRFNSLCGSLPPEVFLLTSLTTLDVSRNGLTGTVPSQIGLLTDLQSLMLGGNSFSGTIPPTIAELRALTTLTAPHNQFDLLPVEVTLLQSLETLDFSRNRLGGYIYEPLPGMFPNLTTLNLSHNQLSGSLPPGWRLKNLAHFDLSYNRFSGQIPTTVGNWELGSVQYLSVKNNRLGGPIPSELGLVTTLRELDLSETLVHGTVPQEVCRLANLTLFYDVEAVDCDCGNVSSVCQD